MSSGKRLHYEDYIDLPEIRAVCLSCECEDCKGICDIYRNAVRKHLSLSPLIRHPKNKMPPREKRPYTYNRLYEIDGVAHTLREWSAITGIEYHTLYMRMKRYGMTIHEAIEKSPRRVGIPKYITANGETLTVKAWAERLGLAYNTIHDRIRRGYSEERAVTTPRMQSVTEKAMETTERRKG